MTAKKVTKKIVGRAAGGYARAEKLGKKELSEQGKRAALARWNKGVPQAFSKGNFEKDFGINVDCYVLDDSKKTAVISQSGMGEALGLARRGNALPRFIGSKSMSEFVGAQLRSKLEQPLKFKSVKGSALTYGYDVTILVDICHAITEAEDSLDRQQKHVARQARVILNASAKAGIKGLVYALAGYNPTQKEVVEAFKAYVLEEAKKYEKEFPDELYEQWYRLYEITPPERGKSWKFKHLTVKHIYYPLAHSNGKLLELMRALKAKGGGRNKKLFQFLNDVGARALRMQLGRVLEMAESSKDVGAYEEKILERFGNEKQLTLDI